MVSLWYSAFGLVQLLRHAYASECPHFADTDLVFRSADWVHGQAAVGAIVLLDSRGSFGGHIQGATHATWQDFTRGGFASPEGGLLKSDAEVKESLRLRGVPASKPVVVYGDWDRAWGEEGRMHWMLKLMGHRMAYILAGGLQAYREAYPSEITDSDDRPPAAAAWQDSELDVAPAIRATKVSIRDEVPFLIDLRATEEYDGSKSRPYGVSRNGHAAGAVSLPYQQLFDNSCLKSCSAITDWLKDLGWQEGRKIAAYCTGGIRSGFFWSVLLHCDFGPNQIANYDGSMWEWAADNSMPMMLPGNISSTSASVRKRRSDSTASLLVPALAIVSCALI